MAGTRSIGTVLTLVGAGSEADLVIGNVVSFGEVATEADEIDTTTLDSPNRAKEFIQGMKDSGETTFELNNVFDGTVATLNSIFDAGETRSWTVGWPDNTGTISATLSLDAYIKGRAYGEATPDGLNKAMFTIRISGEPEYVEV